MSYIVGSGKTIYEDPGARPLTASKPLKPLQARSILQRLAEGISLEDVREELLQHLDARERRVVELSASGWDVRHICESIGLDPRNVDDRTECKALQRKHTEEIKGMQQLLSRMSSHGQITEIKMAGLKALTKGIHRAIRIVRTTDNENSFWRGMEFLANRCGLPVTQQQDIKIQNQQEYIMSAQFRAVMEMVQTGRVIVDLDQEPPDALPETTEG